MKFIILVMTNLLRTFFIVGAFFVAGSAQVNVPAGPQPTLISAPDPVYPKDAKGAGIGGRITVRVTVSETGEVLSVDNATGPAELCKGSRSDPRLKALRDSVVAALGKAKFSPALKDGKQVKSSVWLGSTFDPSAGESSAAPENKKLVAVGFVTGKALRMLKPEYPSSARPTRASGGVPVRVVIDESGDVFTAEAIGGHPLLRSAAVDSACKAKFSSTEIDGKAVRITGVITYNFTPN
ncbi:MAG: energy transducer TonB [Pyrinomonadaceae bacterium]